VTLWSSYIVISGAALAVLISQIVIASKELYHFVLVILSAYLA